ncbi:hypothetical protein, partial [Streptomyces sp. MBT56]|uniref:hypothetical protein n=1 Tax=Streptomyces sp. MBT56 TaxID=1488387 RepID=UPI001909D811
MIVRTGSVMNVRSGSRGLDDGVDGVAVGFVGVAALQALAGVHGDPPGGAELLEEPGGLAVAEVLAGLLAGVVVEHAAEIPDGQRDVAGLGVRDQGVEAQQARCQGVRGPDGHPHPHEVFVWVPVRAADAL